MPENPNKMSNTRFVVTWSVLLALVLAIAITINIGMNVFRGYVDLYLGGGDIIITQTEGLSLIHI